MGIDACIYVKTSDGQEPELCDGFPYGASLKAAGINAPAGATYEVDQSWLYYGKGCERGPWPRIAAVLMTLHASPNVETVWYFGDSSEGDEPFTPERVNEMNAYYMQNGVRPYYQ